MPKRSSEACDNRLGMESRKFIIDTDTKETWVRVSDDESHTLLQGVIDAINGGSSGTPVNYYNEISSISSATETTIVSYTAPGGVTSYLQKVKVSGNNIAEYQVKVNGTTVDKCRTYFGGDLSTNFDFTGSGNSGYVLTAGDIVTITVIHNRPMVGTFNGRIQSLEI